MKPKTALNGVLIMIAITGFYLCASDAHSWPVFIWSKVIGIIILYLAAMAGEKINIKGGLH